MRISLKDKQKTMLLLRARQAMRRAYSPYSGQKVGGALITSSGNVYLGANIGNSCSALNCCAEQVAIAQAVMNKDTNFVAIALIQSPGGFCLPCGRCLQLLSEFAKDMIVLTSEGNRITEYRLNKLLPLPYRRCKQQQYA